MSGADCAVALAAVQGIAAVLVAYFYLVCAFDRNSEYGAEVRARRAARWAIARDAWNARSARWAHPPRRAEVA